MAPMDRDEGAGRPTDDSYWRVPSAPGAPDQPSRSNEGGGPTWHAAGVDDTPAEPTQPTPTQAPPSAATPGWATPGWAAPGTTAPGTTAPGTTAPGTTAPGTTVPGWSPPSPPSPPGGTAATWGPAPEPVARHDRPSRRNAFLAVLAALIVLLGATFGYALGRSNSSNSPSATQSPFGNQAPFGNQSPFGNGNNGSNGSGSNGSTNNGASSGSAASVASKVNPGIVNVTSVLGNGEAKGSGMVISSDGLVLTNNHVIDGARSIRVELVATGKTYDAKVLGYAASEDVGLLKIDGASDLQTVTTSTGDVSVNDDIVVIGNAGGQDGTPTVVTGTVTATDQSITASDATGFDAERLSGLIQLSAPVVEGDSGGAVANMDGEVVGMTTAASRNGLSAMSANSPTVAFAIPIEHALGIAHQIENGDESSTVHIGEHGILGVAVQGGGGFGSDGGALVAGVESGSAAEDAGLREGDTITAVDGHSIGSPQDLDDAMTATHVGDHVTVKWQDANGQTQQASVTLEDGAA